MVPPYYWMGGESSLSQSSNPVETLKHLGGMIRSGVTWRSGGAFTPPRYSKEKRFCMARDRPLIRNQVGRIQTNRNR